MIDDNMENIRGMASSGIRKTKNMLQGGIKRAGQVGNAIHGGFARVRKMGGGIINAGMKRFANNPCL